MADFYVFETKVPGGVAPEIVDALALLKGESEALLGSYQRDLDIGLYHGRFNDKELIKLRALERNVVSIVAASIKRQVAIIVKRAARLRATAEFSGRPGDGSAIVMNHNIGGFENGVSAYLWFKENADGRCIGTLEWCDCKYRDNQIVRFVVDAASFDEAYDYIESHEGELMNEMVQLLEDKRKECSGESTEAVAGGGE